LHPNFILFLAIFFLLSSCTSKVNTFILSDNNEEIEYLESLAIQATKDRRLTTPKNNSAFLFYRKILLLNPNHQGAIEGISNLSEIYLSWAIRSVESLEFLKAKEYIKKAEFLDPDNLNIVSVKKMVAKRSQQKTILFSLNKKNIVERATSQLNFEAIANYLSGSDSYVIIESPNDADGRWIYQKINEITSDRIKATFRTGRSSTVLIFQ
tara:strand:+ start:514 stop:1143 length:630 start_codon:yes stop_codon:yes gene_type:complete